MIVAIDIGYSNINLVFGKEKKELTKVIFPSTAALSSDISKSLLGEEKVSQRKVRLNNQDWVIGEPATKIQNFSRELNANYTKTEKWIAMLYAALDAVGVTEIDALALGLPMAQYQTDIQRDLEKFLNQEHLINQRKVQIKSVYILPQSVGPWFDIISNSPKDLLNTISLGNVLIIDPGFFSVDSAFFAEGNFFDKSSATSMWAVSKILEEANDILSSRYGRGLSIEKIEECIKSNNFETILSSIANVDLQKIVYEAADKVSKLAITDIVNKLRKDGKNIDIVILAGGGSEFYIKSVESYFSGQDIQIIKVPDPVFSVVKGFWYFAARKSQQK